MLRKDIRTWVHGALSIDLEIAPDRARIIALAAVRADSGDSFTYSDGDLRRALRELDEFSRGTSFLLGHNIIQHDRPYLRKLAPKAALLQLPVLDTLYLSPLAFPRNPYHRLVKHYKDGALRRLKRNDPKLDAQITLELLTDQCAALAKVEKDNPRLLLAWHGLMTAAASGFDAFFTQLRRRQVRPTDEQTRAACQAALLDYGACASQVEHVVPDARGWPLAYALAWTSVAKEGNSVLPPWVRHEFPETAPLVTALRDTACTAPECAWCRERHDARSELKRWTGFDAFRPASRTTDGHPMQQAIVETAMGRRHVLGILPTGTGKSLCYQVPALSRYAKTGALTVVISPLVALMADQVRGMERKGIHCAATYNSMLSMPERGDVLDRIRLGDIGILITSPEQLRSRTVRRTLEQREIGAWVLDEAHCLAKWGHDFRPDYRYVSRFIARYPPVPPILCLTATAKQDVITEIKDHFQKELGIAELEIYDGGMERDNLVFRVHKSPSEHKYADLAELLKHESLKDGGVIIYCYSKAHTEELAEFLTVRGISVDYFHGGLSPEGKKDVQQRFIDGKLQVVTATNAFGMGIDKPDVRLVVHADMPGALEDYLQEAGRAGRDGDVAQCVLLYDSKDVENQFRLAAYSRLNRAEIAAVLRALRRLDDRARKRSEYHNSTAIEVTTGELLLEEESATFRRDKTTDDTRVRTAVAWLEEARLLARGDNWVKVFPSSLRVDSIEEAQRRIEQRVTNKTRQKRLLAVVRVMLAAGNDESVSTDQLMQVIGAKDPETAREEVRKALHDLENLGISSNDTAITVYVHQGVANSSVKRLEEAAALEQALIRLLRELAPDQGPGGGYPLHLRVASQRLKDANLLDTRPEWLRIILHGLATDGRGGDGKGGSLTLKSQDRESVRVYLNRDWDALEETAVRRRDAAYCLLKQLLSHLPPKARGVDLLAETTLGKLYQAIRNDIELRIRAKDPQKLADRALLWMHELEILRLHKGMLVFRPAMTIKLERSQRHRQFTQDDFEPLKLHYKEQVAAIHIMAEYAQRGQNDMRVAQRLAADYFRMPRQAFIDKWLAGREKEIELPTTTESQHAIVGPLNTQQRAIVTDSREHANVLVLAGPGSGKTRVIVHRIAYLVRVRRENPKSIIALTYNRHTAVDIRRRLAELIDADARRVTVLTCHALAMRLCGASFADRANSFNERRQFDKVLEDAVSLLKGERQGLEPAERNVPRERLLAGFRWICVDEYQDVDKLQYELISALAGRTLQDPDMRLNLLAVGDDDQNIYAFAGASVEYIRRFAEDYEARPMNLIENYRSTRYIIEAANCVIAPAAERQKKATPIRIDRRRERAPPGGDWERLDPEITGHVQLLQTGADSMQQAIHVMDELKRMQGFDKGWNWSRVAVISRQWIHLEPVRAYCEHHNIPVQPANEGDVPVWRLRETQALVQHLRVHDGAALIKPEELRVWIRAQQRAPDTPEASPIRNCWWQLLGTALEEYLLEHGTREILTATFIEWLAEWAHEARCRPNGLQLLSAHRAKGLEFDHVAVLDGSWESRRDKSEDPDTGRRLYYVAMTRARKTLVLCHMNQPHPVLDGLTGAACFRQSREMPPPAYIPSAMHRCYLSLSPRCVDIGYAGRFEPHKPIHKAITALHPGDRLTLKQESGYSWLQTPAGIKVGKLARAKQTRDELKTLHELLRDEDMECISAQVNAIFCRRREDVEHRDSNQVQYADPRCNSWEVVLPKLVFAPKDPGRS